MLALPVSVLYALMGLRGIDLEGSKPAEDSWANSVHQQAGVPTYRDLTTDTAAGDVQVSIVQGKVG